MLAVETLADGIESLAHHTFLQADTGHRTPSLRFDENLPFAVLGGADLIAREIVGAQEPSAVPAVAADGPDHAFHLFHSPGGFVVHPKAAA